MRGLSSHARVFNAFEYVWLLEFDLAALLERMFKARTDMEAKLYARLLILTMYESLLEMRRLFAKSLREQAVDAMADDTADLSFKRLHARIESLFRTCRKRFGRVRNELVAHRTGDPELRSQLLLAVDTDLVGRLAGETLQLAVKCQIELDRYAKAVLARIRRVGA